VHSKAHAKGGAERTIGYLQTSFLPMRAFGWLDDLQIQHDAWTGEVAVARRLRRAGWPCSRPAFCLGRTEQ